jgi:hypothetical protein
MGLIQDYAKIDTDLASRCFAEATTHILYQELVKQGYKESRAEPSIEWLVGKRKPRYDMGTHPPGTDHPTIWTKAGKPMLYLSQPYNLGDHILKEMCDFGEKWALEFWIRTWPGFHFPGHILSVWWCRKNTFGFPQI